MSRLTGLPRMSQMAARVIGWKYPTTETTNPSNGDRFWVVVATTPETKITSA